MPTRHLFTSLLTILLITSSCMSDKKADLILFNGTIYTVDESFSKAEAMAVRDGMILAVGSTNDILKQYDTEKSIDLEGKFVYPGLIDAHCHFLGYGNSLLHADLVGTTSFEDIVDLLIKRQEDSPFRGRPAALSNGDSRWGGNQEALSGAIADLQAQDVVAEC